MFTGSEQYSLSYCKCPIPCRERIYDPVLTHARISNYDLDEFLHKSNARRIEERFVEAREASERIMAPLVNDNTQQIVDMAHALTEVTLALEKVSISDNTVHRNKVTPYLGYCIQFEFREDT